MSVIVSCYNVKPYIDDCLNSILARLPQNIEVIIVDDFSCDGTLERINIFAKGIDRLKVLVHSKNLGLSDARNTGLKYASGEYIMHIDGDDWLADDALSRISSALCGFEGDILEFGFCRVDSTGRLIRKTLPKHSWTLSEYLSGQAIRMAWTKVVRRSSLLANNVRFESDRYHEDIYYTYHLYSRVPLRDCINACIYNWRVRPISISNTISDKHIRDSVHAFRMIREDLEREGSFDVYRRDFITGTLAYLCGLQGRVYSGVLSSSERVKLVEYLNVEITRANLFSKKDWQIAESIQPLYFKRLTYTPSSQNNILALEKFITSTRETMLRSWKPDLYDALIEKEFYLRLRVLISFVDGLDKSAVFVVCGFSSLGRIIASLLIRQDVIVIDRRAAQLETETKCLGDVTELEDRVIRMGIFIICVPPPDSKDISEKLLAFDVKPNQIVTFTPILVSNDDDSLKKDILYYTK